MARPPVCFLKRQIRVKPQAEVGCCAGTGPRVWVEGRGGEELGVGGSSVKAASTRGNVDGRRAVACRSSASQFDYERRGLF